MIRTALITFAAMATFAFYNAVSIKGLTNTWYWHIAQYAAVVLFIFPALSSIFLSSCSFVVIGILTVLLIALMSFSVLAKKKAELPAPSPNDLHIMVIDLDAPFQAAAAKMYSDGRAQVDSMANEWRKNYNEVYLVVVAERETNRLIGGLTSDFEVKVFVEDYDEQKITTSLFLQLYIEHQQKQAAAAARAAQK